jgi:hypothetical protein
VYLRFGNHAGCRASAGGAVNTVSGIVKKSLLNGGGKAAPQSFDAMLCVHRTNWNQMRKIATATQQTPCLSRMDRMLT